MNETALFDPQDDQQKHATITPMPPALYSAAQPGDTGRLNENTGTIPWQPPSHPWLMPQGQQQVPQQQQWQEQSQPQTLQWQPPYLQPSPDPQPWRGQGQGQTQQWQGPQIQPPTSSSYSATAAANGSVVVGANTVATAIPFIPPFRREEVFTSVTPAPDVLPSAPPLPTVPEPPKQKLLEGGHKSLAMKELPAPSDERPTIVEADTEGSKSWEAFLELKKFSEEASERMTAFFANVTHLQLTHEKEACAYRDAARGQIEQQRQQIDVLKDDYAAALAKVENLSSVLARKADQLTRSEQRAYELSVEATEARQRVAHVEDRANLAESGRQIAEIKQNELQRALDHTTEIVKSLRGSLSDAQKDKLRSMQAQYEVYEENRKEVIAFYNSREKEIISEFNETVKAMQGTMEEKMKEREEHLSKYWRELIKNIEERYNTLVKEVDIAKELLEKDYNARVVRLEQDKERWYDQYRGEMATLETRHREREDHVLADIARRERELSEREQRMRVQRAQDEQDAKVMLLSKEAELKAYYEKIVEDLRTAHEKDREKLLGTFREQLLQLSNQHLANERELERLHRDKEREMAQRYRVAGYEVDDRKGQLELRDVGQTSQSSLLSKFDSIEARQRERAEKTRLALKDGTSVIQS